MNKESYKDIIKDTIERVIKLRDELKDKGLNKGFWVSVNEKDFKPLKDKDDNIIVRFNKLKTDIIGIDEKEYKVKNDEFIGKKFAFITFEFNNDFLKLSIDEIKKNNSKYLNYIICKLTIIIQVVRDTGTIGGKKWECIINFTLDDLIDYHLKYKDVEYFMRNTADKLVLSNNMVGIPFKGYKIALDKELKKNIKDKEDNDDIMTPKLRELTNKIKDTIVRVNKLKDELKDKKLNKGFWVLADDKDFKPLKDKNDNIIDRFNILKTDILGIDEKEHYVKENKFKNKKIAWINFGFDVDFLRLPIEEIKKNYDEYKNHLVLKLIIMIMPIEKDGEVNKFPYECRINFTLDDLMDYHLKYKDVEYFMRNTADKLVLSHNMIGIAYKGYKIALDKGLKKNIKDKEDNNNIMTPKLRELTKSELDEIKFLEKKDKENDDKWELFKKDKIYNGKKIPLKKFNEYDNYFINEGHRIRQNIKNIKRKPRDEYYIQKIKDAYKRKEFDKETRDDLILGVERGGSDELDLYYKNKGLPTEYDYEKGHRELMQKEKEDYEKYLESVKKPVKEKKTYKESNLMKGRSDLVKRKDGKYSVDTEMAIKKGLDPKVKKALKKSIVEEAEKKISGSGVRKIELDYSSSEDEKPKRRGRPKKGKGYDSDSSSDEEDIKEYGKILKHLIGHIKDPKEKIDPKDYKQAIELIKKIKSKKA